VWTIYLGLVSPTKIKLKREKNNLPIVDEIRDWLQIMSLDSDAIYKPSHCTNNYII
jgi:hypothetical protein